MWYMLWYSAAHQRSYLLECNRAGVYVSFFTSQPTMSTASNTGSTCKKMLFQNSSLPMQRRSLSVLAYCAVHVRCSLRENYSQSDTRQPSVRLCRFLGRPSMLHSDNLISPVYAFVSHYLFYTSSHQQNFTSITFWPPRPMGAPSRVKVSYFSTHFTGAHERTTLGNTLSALHHPTSSH